MRIVLSLIILLSALAIGSGASSAELMCAEPSARTPEATPAAQVAPEGNFPDDGGELTIFAAASLTDAYDEIATNLMDQHPDLKITIETAGSQSLVTQLEEGASADVLATANTSTMDRAVNAGLISGDPVIFISNRLVIVTPAGNPAEIESIDDLAGDGVLLVVANPDVPAGRYASEAFCRYASEDGVPAGFLEAINANIASEETDVRHVLTKVQLGEADAGVVYASDATASGLSGVQLQVVEFPAGVPTRAEYPIAAIEGGNINLANAFIAYVLSDEGQEILCKYGFD